MNTLGLLQIKWSPKGFMLTLQEIWSTHDSMNIQKLNLLLIHYVFTFMINILNIKIIFNLGIKTVLY